MKDEIDVLISVKLKNWAARQSPPESGRARLLGQIALLEALEGAKMWPIDSNDHPRSKKNRKPIMEWFGGPFIRVHLWSLHLDSTYRLVC